MNKFIMNKSKFLGTFLGTAVLLGLGACSGDELSNESGQQTGDRLAISFDGTRSSDETKKTYYGTSGSNTVAFWSSNDRIAIYSPAAAPWGAQQGIYNKDYVHVSGSVIAWNTGNATQDLYAYYPANSANISGIGAADGSAIFSVPANQSSMATFRPTNASGTAHPLAFSIAAKKNVSVSSGGSVIFSFNDFMNVIRMNISNPKGYAIKSIKMASATTGQPVAGQVKVTPQDNGTYGYVIANTNNELTVDPTAQTSATFAYDMYLLPQSYASGIKITITYDDGVDANKEWINTTSSFSQGAFKILNMTIPTSPPSKPNQSKDMGILVRSEFVDDAVMTRAIGTLNYSLVWDVGIDGTAVEFDEGNSTLQERKDLLGGARPLYFADGNLLIPNNTIHPSGTPYIGTVTASTKVEQLFATVNSNGYAQDTYNRGFFKWGVPDGDWTKTNATGYFHISGNPTYDIARATIGEGKTGIPGWRLPTGVEWAFLMEITSRRDNNHKWPQKNGYYNDGLSFTSTVGSYAAGGYINQPANGVLAITANGETLYLPLVGHRNTGGAWMSSVSSGNYWSGSTNIQQTGNGRASSFGLQLYIQSTAWSGRYWNVNRSFGEHGYAVRPVSE